jgi:hypothetical protein
MAVVDEVGRTARAGSNARELESLARQAMQRLARKLADVVRRASTGMPIGRAAHDTPIFRFPDREPSGGPTTGQPAARPREWWLAAAVATLIVLSVVAALLKG